MGSLQDVLTRLSRRAVLTIEVRMFPFYAYRLVVVGIRGWGVGLSLVFCLNPLCKRSLLSGHYSSGVIRIETNEWGLAQLGLPAMREQIVYAESLAPLMA
jgi:hypothetical protein